MLVGPQGRAVEIVERPVAVRPDDGHVAGGGNQGALQVCAVLALQETGRVADGAAGAKARKFS